MLIAAGWLWCSDRRTPPSTHYGGIGRIREMGEIVAMRLDCTDSGWAREASRWFGRGRCLLINSEIVVEYRYDIRSAVIRRDGDGVEVRLPPCEVTVNHGAIDVVFMQHGTVFGVPLRRLDEADISRLIADARTNVASKRGRADDELLQRARERVRTLLLDYARVIAPSDSVSVTFTDEIPESDSPSLLRRSGGTPAALAGAPASLNLPLPGKRAAETVVSGV